MKTTKRFNTAVKKLYTAYHNDELEAMDCKRCAVGNMCDNTRDWNILSLDNYLDYKFDNKTGYSNIELLNIESLFMFGTSAQKPLITSFSNGILHKDHEGNYIPKREAEFLGLCAVIEYLAELDNIPNPFDFSNLFNDNKTVADKELELILN